MPLLTRLSILSFLALLFFPLSAAHALSPSQAPPPMVGQLDADNPLVGRIFDAGTGAEVPLAEALERARRAEVLLLGERHDNEDHHALQAYILGDLIRSGLRPALIFEMINENQAQALESWRTRPTPNAGDLDKLLSWEWRGWPNFSWYEPLFRQALAQGLLILPGNPPRSQVQAIARGQDPQAVTALGLDRPLPEPLNADLLETLRGSHCGMVPETSLAPIALAQRAKDATMARAVITALTKGAQSAVIITGAEHARTDRGIPYYLPAGLSHLSIAFTEASEGETDPLAYGEAKAVIKGQPPHDLLWFTPRVDREDPCAGLEAFFGQEAE